MTAKRRVLLVEDELLIAMLFEDMLEKIGCEVTCVLSHVDAAVDAARDGEFDFAVLDLNIEGGFSTGAAEVLAERGIPFIFATGYGKGGLEGRHGGATILQKPFSEADLKRAMDAVLAATHQRNR